MTQDVLQGDPVLGSDAQAGMDKVLYLIQDRVLAVPQLGTADLLVLLEGDVALDPAEEKDAEGSEGGGAGLVECAAYPLRGHVHARPVKVGEGLLFLLDEGAGAEVNEAELPGLEVHKQVLVLEVTMVDAVTMTSNDGGHPSP
jgi:hypothetical protein